jgi:hypothetical protein
MKKALATLCLFGLVFISCGKNEGIFTACYTCTTTITTTTSPSLQGYPQTTTTTTTPCDLTAKQAREVEEGMTATSTTTSAGYAITVKSTCKCIKK